MASNLLCCQDGFFIRRQRGDLGQLGKLHVLETLAVLDVSDGTGVPLDVVDVPSFADDGDDRDVLARDDLAFFDDAATVKDPLDHLLELAALLLFEAPAKGEHPLNLVGKFVVGVVVLVAQFAHLASRPTPHLDRALALLDPVVVADVDDVRRRPIKLCRRDVLGPALRVAIELGLVGRWRHGADDPAPLGVALVLLTGAKVEEHRRVGVVDWLEADALAFVLLVVGVDVVGTQLPRAEPASDGLFTAVAVGLVSAAVVLVSPQLASAQVGQFVIKFGLGVTRAEPDADVGVAHLVDDADDGRLHLVELHLGPTAQLLRQRAFPLCASDGCKAAVLHALAAFVGLRALHLVELLEGVCVNAGVACVFGFSGHRSPPGF